MTGKIGRVAGKVAIVTGAGIHAELGYNIGGAIATVLAREGAKVVATEIAREEACVNRLAEQVRADGGDLTPMVLDQGDEEQIKSVVAKAVSTYGGIDILCNNATAIFPEDTDLLGTTTELWDRTMQVNPRGVFLFSKHAMPHMLKRGGGSIVNTSSGSGITGDDIRIAYGASKGAINTLTKYIATQYGKQGIRCNAIMPGLTMSSHVKQVMPTEGVGVFERHTLTPYLGDPMHIANMALFLASDEAAYVTAEVISVDGGLLAHQTYLADFRGKPKHNNPEHLRFT